MVNSDAPRGEGLFKTDTNVRKRLRHHELKAFVVGLARPGRVRGVPMACRLGARKGPDVASRQPERVSTGRHFAKTRGSRPPPGSRVRYSS